jgi:hypothetical protein
MDVTGNFSSNGMKNLEGEVLQGSKIVQHKNSVPKNTTS